MESKVDYTYQLEPKDDERYIINELDFIHQEFQLL